MAKAVALLVSALCFVAFAGFAHCETFEEFLGANQDAFGIVGQVYCDTCRVKFQNRLSTPLKDAVVRLECRDIESGFVTYTANATTNEMGTYQLTVQGDHDEEICEMIPESSPDDDCEEPVDEHALITLTKKNGLASQFRYPNPLSFQLHKEDTPSECAQMLQELNLIP